MGGAGGGASPADLAKLSQQLGGGNPLAGHGKSFGGSGGLPGLGGPPKGRKK